MGPVIIKVIHQPLNLLWNLHYCFNIRYNFQIDAFVANPSHHVQRIKHSECNYLPQYFCNSVIIWTAVGGVVLVGFKPDL